ncbi:Hypothetical protein Tpal_1753 [Trichococcus palustris]|jgi:putative endonuclease|uniref:GIY-YIG domain-containing protein n=1 Tax=Trichococcus palustris TaxID=140314 RepID=A0A143YRP4_9LACT|nr:GIY-YIG nuclease family protein [Trichococcus palustris]CZQ94156.1 Hypothetical protein Tpal_1753 [Trichococcus palustris]SFL18296.1 putative endonuclease [Trichococcus palustris]
MVSSNHYFYVLQCADRSFYAGYSTDVIRREKEHNGGIGSKYTKARRPIQLIYAENYGTRPEATKAEAAFKKLTRKQKEDYLSGRGICFPIAETMSALTAVQVDRKIESKPEENQHATAEKL